MMQPLLLGKDGEEFLKGSADLACSLGVPIRCEGDRR